MKVRRYASQTRVPVEKTRAEIEQMLHKHEATATAIFMSRETSSAAVAFEMRGRRILFKLRMPPDDDKNAARDQRELWRSLLLSIKAKLVSVENDIETFEDAFMAHIVMPDGSTVAEHVKPRIESAYKEGKMLPLLPGPSKH